MTPWQGQISALSKTLSLLQGSLRSFHFTQKKDFHVENSLVEFHGFIPNVWDLENYLIYSDV